VNLEALAVVHYPLGDAVHDVSVTLLAPMPQPMERVGPLHGMFEPTEHPIQPVNLAHRP
jgi:hypothetical protein